MPPGSSRGGPVTGRSSQRGDSATQSGDWRLRKLPGDPQVPPARPGGLSGLGACSGQDRWGVPGWGPPWVWPRQQT